MTGAKGTGKKHLGVAFERDNLGRAAERKLKRERKWER